VCCIMTLSSMVACVKVIDHINRLVWPMSYIFCEPIEDFESTLLIRDKHGQARKHLQSKSF
jgi:hypothetical protein